MNSQDVSVPVKCHPLPLLPKCMAWWQRSTLAFGPNQEFLFKPRAPPARQLGKVAYLSHHTMAVVIIISIIDRVVWIHYPCGTPPLPTQHSWTEKVIPYLWWESDRLGLQISEDELICDGRVEHAVASMLISTLVLFSDLSLHADAKFARDHVGFIVDSPHLQQGQLPMVNTIQRHEVDTLIANQKELISTMREFRFVSTSFLVPRKVVKKTVAVTTGMQDQAKWPFPPFTKIAGDSSVWKRKFLSENRSILRACPLFCLKPEWFSSSGLR